jgi:predicted nucleic acid-binding protein
VVGETCTLLVRRKRVHLVAKFLDYLDRSAALLLINPDDTLLRSAKAMIRRQADQGYSFVDCLSFCLMSEESRRGIDHRCAFPEGRFHSLAAVNRLSQWIINF